MEKKRDVDDVGGVETVAELFNLFGTRRAVALIGWSTWWGVSGVTDLKELRLSLEARGLSYASAYRATADFRKFREYLESKEKREFSVLEAVQVLRVL
jgi:hypothetical protein